MERGQLASGVWGKGSWDAVWRWGSCPAASAIKWGSPSCCSPPDWQELSLSNELPPNRGTSFLWLGMRTIPRPLCGSQAWCLHVGDIQAQHIPCVSTTPSSLVPGEGSTGGDHGVSRAKGLLARVNPTAQGSLSISCADLVCDTNRGAHSLKYLSCPAPVSNDGLFTRLSWAD